MTPFPPAGERGQARDSLEGTRHVGGKGDVVRTLPFRQGQPPLALQSFSTVTLAELQILPHPPPTPE